jgi:hypothetical protein
MRTRIIVLAAFLAALVVDVVWIWTWTAPSAGPSAGLWTTVLHHLPALALAAFALYALVALILVAGMIVIDTARVRLRLARLGAPNRSDWTPLPTRS